MPPVRIVQVTIRRYASCPWGTFGHLLIDGKDWTCHTVERPWVSNIPFKSCVPLGRYRCIRRDHFTKTEAKYVLVGLGVYEREHEMPESGGRYACLIHAANIPGQVAGCVGLGAAQAFIMGKWGVGRSIDHTRTFNSMMPDEFDLEII